MYSNGAGTAYMQSDSNKENFFVPYTDILIGKNTAKGFKRVSSYFKDASNGEGIDWRGVGNASLLLAGGVAEMAIGGVVEFFSAGTSTPLTVPMMIDGAGRTVANAQRLGMYLKGNSKMADASPTSLGAAVGKFGDLASGVPLDQVGKGQAIIGTVNDFTSFVAAGGSGYVIENMVTNPSWGNSFVVGFTWGGYVYSMSENCLILQQ